MLFVRTEEGKARLVEHMADGNKAKTEAAPAVAVLAVDTEFYKHIPNLFPIRPEMKDYFESDEAAASSTSRFNAALQAGYVILAIRAQGLVAGPMAAAFAAMLLATPASAQDQTDPPPDLKASGSIAGPSAAVVADFGSAPTCRCTNAKSVSACTRRSAASAFSNEASA